LLELIGIEAPTVVGIHAVEDVPELANANAAFVLDGEAQVYVELADHALERNAVEGHICLYLKLIQT